MVTCNPVQEWMHSNLPFFLSFLPFQAVYTASIPEDLSVHSVVLRVGATDADIGTNAWIQYSLQGLGSQDFRIDPDSGWGVFILPVTAQESAILCLPPGEIKTSVVLDRELTDAYRLLAQATDGGGRWCRAEVKLKVTDVNDNPPLFAQSQYSTSIYEDTVPKALLTRTPAIDPDEGDPVVLKVRSNNSQPIRSICKQTEGPAAAFS